jgi:hypothetical protein
MNTVLMSGRIYMQRLSAVNRLKLKFSGYA